MMIGKPHMLLAGALFVATIVPAAAQGTYSNGVRSGYSGTNSGSPNATATSAGTPSSPTSTSRNVGAGQGRTEGALGLTPQLQREMGIRSQQ